jgi:predicted O-methyltransferase YrrM
VLPTYHLDLLLTDRATREAKVTRYNAELFGLRTAEGQPVNTAYYLPEAAQPAPATAEIPPDDAERIERAIRASVSETGIAPASIACHDRDRIGWYAPRSRLPSEDYRATVELARPLPVFVAEHGEHPVSARVTNDGGARWPGGEGREPRIQLGAYWRGLDRSSRTEAGRAFLPHTLDPGETTLVVANLTAPPRAGSIELVIDLVQGNRWFDSSLTLGVDVQPSTRERLDALAGRYGPLVPVAALIEERRAIARPSGLLRPDSPGAPPADARMEEVTRSLSLGGWAIDGATIDTIAELVRELRPRAVVEFGSGTSTVVLAALMRELHADRWPRVVSVENDSSSLEQTRIALGERGLADVAEVVHAPLGRTDDDQPPCYLVDDVAASFLRLHPPELIFVDGPSLQSGASRLSTLDLVVPFLQRDAIVLLDDALRDAELCIAEAWQRRPDVTVHGVRLTPKGLLEATLSPV